MENQENKKETKWRQIYEDDNELDSDEDPDEFIANHELNQSKFISEMLKNDPLDKVYIKKEDNRCGQRFKPLQLIRSFQKQRVTRTKVQFKYHEAEMMDLD